MIHTFSGCVLGSAVECDLDELLATRLVSFLMDHQQSILSVPEYLLNAISNHLCYLRSVQVHAGTKALFTESSLSLNCVSNPVRQPTADQNSLPLLKTM